MALTLTGCGFPEPDTPLAAAAMRGDTPAVRELLARGADPNGRDSHGLTPLMLAARLGRIDAMKALLAGGADPDLRYAPRTRPGWTPIMNAVHKGQIESVRVLIAAKADVNESGGDGTTALMLAAPEPSEAIVGLLLDAGADPRPGHGGSAALTNAAAGGRTETVTLLLARAPDLKLESGIRGTAALMLARLRCRREILTLLRTSGAS